MLFLLIHPLLRLNFSSPVPRSPFSSYSNSHKKYSSVPRQSSTSKVHHPSPLEPPRFSSCRITFPPIFCPHCLSFVLPSITPRLYGHGFLIMVINVRDHSC